jgi:methionine-R-sulfoxide reductase
MSMSNVEAQDDSSGQMVKVRIIGPNGTLTAPMLAPKVEKTDAEWQKQLTPEQYKITRAKGTEPAFCGNLLDNHREGIYHCVDCGLPLFSSDAKFNSGTGWPSFFQPVAEENVVMKRDDSYGMQRTEILCARCGGHLGHVFDDGPAPTRLRFCLNSAALTFVDKGKEIPEQAGIGKAAR